MHGRSHGLHFESLEGKGVKHSSTPSRMELHQTKRIFGLEFPKTSDLLLQPTCSLSQLINGLDLIVPKNLMSFPSPVEFGPVCV